MATAKTSSDDFPYVWVCCKVSCKTMHLFVRIDELILKPVRQIQRYSQIFPEQRVLLRL